MSFKPEIDALLTRVFGQKNCYCEFMHTDEQFRESNRQNPDAPCPGCSTRDTLTYAVIGYLTGRSSKDVLYKVLQYVSSAHPLKLAELLDAVYTLKDKANKFSEKEELDAGNWSHKWSVVFGVSNDKKDDN